MNGMPLRLLLVFLTVFGGQFLPSTVIAAEPQNCESEHNIEVVDTMDVIGKPKQRLDLHFVHPDACTTNSPADGCKPIAYIITGDSVSAEAVCKAWTWVEYSGKRGEIYGWVDSSRLAHAPERSSSRCNIRLPADDAIELYKHETPRGQRQLVDAVMKQNSGLVNKLLAAGIDVNIRGPSYEWVISDAVASCNPVMVRSLLAARADPNVSSCGRRPFDSLDTGPKLGDDSAIVEIAEQLIIAGGKLKGLENSKMRAALLQRAAENGHIRLLAWLLAHGVGVNEENFGITALIMAVDANQVASVKMLLQHGADPNIGGDPSALLRAINMCNPTLVQMLIEHGGNVNERSIGWGSMLYNASNHQRMASLDGPRSKGEFAKIVALLRNAGATESPP